MAARGATHMRLFNNWSSDRRGRQISIFVFCSVLALLELLSGTPAPVTRNLVEKATRATSMTLEVNALTSTASKNDDTTVIILSSLIPTHPSISIINETYQSLKLLKGLSPTAPIFFAVDGSPEGTSKDDIERLAQYVANLKAEFNKSHHHILASNVHLHIAGNIKQAHDLITTPYIYIIQHDFAFRRSINHTAIIKSMNDYPDILRLVLFNKRPNEPRRSDRHGGNCTYLSYPVDHIHGIHFWKTSMWSDNNHLTTWNYYDEVLKMLGNLKRAPEGPLMHHAIRNCSYWGPFMYGKIGDSQYLRHLDGRHAQNVAERLKP